MPFTGFLQKFQFGVGRGWISVKNGSNSVVMGGWVGGGAPRAWQGWGDSAGWGGEPAAGVLRLGGLGVAGGSLAALLEGTAGLEAVGMEKTCGK